MNAITVEIAKLDLKAGEMLAVMVPQLLNAQQREYFHAFMKAGLPEGVKFMLLDGGVTLTTVNATDAIDSRADRASIKREIFDALQRAGKI
jgi:hypothetical protein